MRLHNADLLASERVQWIRAQSEGEADVRVSGPLRKLSAGSMLISGSGIAHLRSGSWGTLGCFVKRLNSTGLYLLSNSHVIANENQGAVGDEVARYGSASGFGQTIASLTEWIQLRRLGVNLHDCAVAELDDAIQIEATLAKPLAQPVEEIDDVLKVGAATGLTRGRITAFDVDDLVFEYEPGDLLFGGQIEITGTDSQPFAARGDSGSLVVASASGGAVGLFVRR